MESINQSSLELSQTDIDVTNSMVREAAILFVWHVPCANQFLLLMLMVKPKAFVALLFLDMSLYCQLVLMTITVFSLFSLPIAVVSDD